MDWEEIRDAYPNQWLLIEDTGDLPDSEPRHNRIQVFKTCANARAAVAARHKYQEMYPQRRFYYVHTNREDLNLEEHKRLAVEQAFAKRNFFAKKVSAFLVKNGQYFYPLLGICLLITGIVETYAILAKLRAGNISFYWIPALAAAAFLAGWVSTGMEEPKTKRQALWKWIAEIFIVLVCLGGFISIFLRQATAGKILQMPLSYLLSGIYLRAYFVFRKTPKVEKQSGDSI